MTISTERVHRHRERRRRGVLAVVPVEVTEGVVHQLIRAGWLDAGAREKIEVGGAISEMLAAMATRPGAGAASRLKPNCNWAYCARQEL